MKWFKHFSNAQHDVRIRRLIKKYGLRGYGLYFACVESIAFQLDTDSPYPDMEESARDIAEEFGEDSAMIEDILHFCVYEQKLFTVNEESGRLACLKLLTHLDNTMSNNPQIKQIINNFKKLEETSSDLKQIRLDKTRVDESKNKEAIVCDDSFSEFWLLYDYKKGKHTAIKKWSKLSDNDKRDIISALPAYVKSTNTNGVYPSRQHATTYLNQRSWEDEVVVIQKPIRPHDKLLKSIGVPENLYDDVYGMLKRRELDEASLQVSVMYALRAKGLIT